jgi:uncharacterized phiE125 gp8 family phage protein
MLKLITAPTVDPVTVDEVQDHLRISGEEAMVSRLIKSATSVIENYLGRRLITQVWDQYFECWRDRMTLFYPPLQTLDSLKYYDLDGTQRTLASTHYWVTTDDPAQIVRAYETTWPELQYGRPQPIVARMTIGYGLEAAVPQDIKDAIKLFATDLYEHRGSVVIGSVSKIPGYVTSLCHHYKIYDF